VLTTRNQDGGCPWCVVRDVTFSNNVVKNNLDNYALNLLGMDSEHASVVGSNLVVTNNLFLNVSKGAQILAPLGASSSGTTRSSASPGNSSDSGRTPPATP
jgi:hypothetical protein